MLHSRHTLFRLCFMLMMNDETCTAQTPVAKDAVSQVHIGFVNADSTLGKDELIYRYALGLAVSYCEVRDGFLDFRTKLVELTEAGHPPLLVKVFLWNIGRERFRAIRDSKLSKMDGFVGVYGTTSEYSLLGLTSDLSKITERKPLVIIGDTIHGDTHKREVSFEQGEAFAKQWKAVAFAELSARDSSQELEEVMNRLLQTIVNQKASCEPAQQHDN